MTDQPKQDSKVIVCPRCSGEMISCEAITYGETRLHVRASQRNFVDKLLYRRQAPVYAATCTNCGYIEFYAYNAAQLRSQQ